MLFYSSHTHEMQTPTAALPLHESTNGSSVLLKTCHSKSIPPVNLYWELL